MHDPRSKYDPAGTTKTQRLLPRRRLNWRHWILAAWHHHIENNTHCGTLLSFLDLWLIEQGSVQTDERTQAPDLSHQNPLNFSFSSPSKRRWRRLHCPFSLDREYGQRRTFPIWSLHGAHDRFVAASWVVRPCCGGVVWSFLFSYYVFRDEGA